MAICLNKPLQTVKKQEVVVSLAEQTLIKHGNSLALVIDKPILEMLQISADTPLKLTTNGDSILTPECDKKRQRQSIMPLVV